MNDSKQWQQHRAFGALDWASEKHSVIVVDQASKVIEDFEIEHSALGWKKFRQKLQPSAVEQLLEAGMMVYPLNPKGAQSYRERKAPSGVKELRLLCRDEVSLIEQRTAFIKQLRQALGEY
jgi:hypothetical protein